MKATVSQAVTYRYADATDSSKTFTRRLTNVLPNADDTAVVALGEALAKVTQNSVLQSAVLSITATVEKG
ncbi:DUF1659 domain-containing protein [Lacticaseibacillus daqingensis]|uniref:DUF1659 domain-containing protein n=1 Tax=Lacticaseibacillus daqingensis TaxID=2486014 RepID=UPI000F7890F0|nr:hypothetical protein [Lacticaseibacillus daqingensis]